MSRSLPAVLCLALLLGSFPSVAQTGRLDDAAWQWNLDDLFAAVDAWDRERECLLHQRTSQN